MNILAVVLAVCVAVNAQQPMYAQQMGTPVGPGDCEPQYITMDDPVEVPVFKVAVDKKKAKCDSQSKPCDNPDCPATCEKIVTAELNKQLEQSTKEYNDLAQEVYELGMSAGMLSAMPGGAMPVGAMPGGAMPVGAMPVGAVPAAGGYGGGGPIATTTTATTMGVPAPLAAPVAAGPSAPSKNGNGKRCTYDVIVPRAVPVPVTAYYIVPDDQEGADCSQVPKVCQGATLSKCTTTCEIAATEEYEKIAEKWSGVFAMNVYPQSLYSSSSSFALSQLLKSFSGSIAMMQSEMEMIKSYIETGGQGPFGQGPSGQGPFGQEPSGQGPFGQKEYNPNMQLGSAEFGSFEGSFESGSGERR